MPLAVPQPRRRRRAPLAIAASVLVGLLSGCGDDPTTTLGTAPPPTSADSTAPANTTGAVEAGTDPNTTLIETEPEIPVVEPLVGHHVPQVVARYPHDPTVFTQGLEFFGDALLESGGGWDESSLRLFDYETGVDRWRLDLAEETLFAEGITIVDDAALQLTWKSETLLVTDLSTAATATPADPERQVGAYQGEGWGLCHDGERLIMSDGSARLTFRDPATFAPTGGVDVVLDGQMVESINELECVGDQVLANIWQANTIVVVDPTSGIVEATIDASALVPEGYTDSNANVLNGIAYHPGRGTFWLTGKRWPVLYEVDFTPA